MASAGKPSIVKDKATKGFVKLTYEPDLARFPGLDLAEMLGVLHTRTIELAAMAGKDVKVSWNGALIATNTFEKFINLGDDRLIRAVFVQVTACYTRGWTQPSR